MLDGHTVEQTPGVSAFLWRPEPLVPEGCVLQAKETTCVTGKGCGEFNRYSCKISALSKLPARFVVASANPDLLVLPSGCSKRSMYAEFIN